MKFAFAVCAAVIAFGSVAVASSEGASLLVLPNGDVEVEAAGSASAAVRTIVELNTNADCRVVCQVYYRDNLNPLPAEIETINETDRIVNLLLAAYFCSECWDMPSEDIVDAYRSGEVFERLLLFPDWAEKMISALNDKDEIEPLDLTVVAVSMTAVGALGQRVAE